MAIVNHCQGCYIPLTYGQLFYNRIQTADNLRIRLEKHPMEEGEIYNSRHHGQHYHVETRRDPTKSWEKKGNAKKLEPNGYNKGDGTGFVPGENYPGII